VDLVLEQALVVALEEVIRDPVEVCPEVGAVEAVEPGQVFDVATCGRSRLAQCDVGRT
jgi:hypothetical protein